MKKFLLALAFFSGLKTFSQTCQDAAVELYATVQTSTPAITLNWVPQANASQYTVYRKLKTATAWGSSLATLSGSVTQYVDNTVSSGVSYEYRVIKTGSVTAFGYINSGIQIPEVADRGKLILLVDSTFITPLAAELKRLEDDLEGDGWTVIRKDVLRNGTVTNVKSFVVSTYSLDPSNTRALFIVGHVPVPYSGNINPDGHPDHQGAWPTDAFYGDIDGLWTDISVTSTTVSPLRTQNIPGDGKYDQSQIPSDVELQVGRVDFSNLPAFSQTEQQLLKNYLDKDHDYRKKNFSAVHRAVLDDNFGYFSGEAFAASGFKNFGPLVGPSNVSQADYFTSMSGGSYLWAYGCGGGTYTSAGGIGATSNFATANLDGVFSMLFGSYFGDWDSQDNFLRAPLAQGHILTNVWSGRPHWVFHHMGLGENIGYDARLSENNNSLYYFNYGGRYVHVGLMGDPTLRNDVVAPVSNVVATKSGNDCVISWSASTETAVIGYNIYMKNDSNQAYVKINSSPVASTTYTDNCLLYKGIYKYMVRTLVLQTSPSGTYYNMSEGIADTAYSNNNMTAYASFSLSVSGNTVNFTNTSVNTTTSFWDFGDASTSSSNNPSHTYANGTYTVMLVASNACSSDTSYLSVTVSSTGIQSLISNTGFNFYPNPAHDKLTVAVNKPGDYEIKVFNSEGREIYNVRSSGLQKELNLSGYKPGVYLLQMWSDGKIYSEKFIVE